jgi:LCP family protein required for cell wall assembly
VVSIVLTLALIAGVVIALFFSYTGKLNRKIDSTVNSGEPPIDSSELVSKADTISKEDQEKKLKELLAQRQKPINNENVMNILIVGEDLRDTQTEERGHTDVQLLVSINKEKKKIVLASFLRDQYLDIAGHGANRLNTAYYYEGIPLLKSTISDYYNINIDRIVKVNFYSFIEVVDTIGGVDIDINQDEFNAINEAIREHNYYLKNPPTKDYIKQPGKQHLNGNQALGYSRIREGCGDDYGRTERQREMITTIISKLKDLSFLELDALINKVAPQITTDITDGEIAYLMYNASSIMKYQICQVQMPHYPYFTEEVINQMAVLVPDYDKCCTLLLDMIYGDSTTVEEAIKKMEAGTINQYTYTTGGGQQQTNADPNAQAQPQDQQQQQFY